MKTIICSLDPITLVAARPADACTNFLISKGASADGSTIITYAADAHEL